MIRASGKPDKLVRYPRNHRNQYQAQQKLQDPVIHADKQKEDYADQHDNQQKACSAALVQTGTLPHILHRKIHPLFNTVDTFVLCAMIHIDTLNIRHQ